MKKRNKSAVTARAALVTVLLLALAALGIGACATTSGQLSAWPEDLQQQKPAPSRDPSLPPVVTAVSPFENIGPNQDDNYIGFQISEFLSSGLASFDGVQVVERSRMQDIFEELNVQLSGLTDESTTLKVGALLNAEQMVVGSYATTPGGITITGRIIQVETGEVLAGTSIESPQAESYTPAFRAFLFALIGRLPEYNITIPVEAQVDTAEQKSREEAADFARALEALFRQDDEKALEYLQQSVGTTQVGFVDFDAVSREYSQVLERLHGQSIFAQLIQNQIAHNQKLTAQLEPLGVYRSTLRVLTDRDGRLITLENAEIEGSLPTPDARKLGDVSAMVPLPEVVTLGMSREAIGRVESFIAEQDIATLSRRGLRLSEAPRGELLSRDILERLFNPVWQAEVEYALEFLDRQGEVLYQLKGTPVRFFEISDQGRVASVTVDASFTPVESRDGWQITGRGEVEIQTRELRDVASMRLVLRPETFRVKSGFELYSNDLWQSLVTHAYRLKSVKTVPEEDIAPAFKEIMITDSWFYSGDSELDPVPMLPRAGKLSAFADLTGVVYFADSASGAVAGSWARSVEPEQGDWDSEPRVISGDFGANTMLRFPLQRRPVLQEGEITFTAEYANSRMTAGVDMNKGSSWASSEDVFLGASSGRVFFQEGFHPYRGVLSHEPDMFLYAKGLVTGEELWRVPAPFHEPEAITAQDGLLLIPSKGMRDAVFAYDETAGKELWHMEENYRISYSVDTFSWGGQAPVDGNVVFLRRDQDRGVDFVAIHALTGRELWSADQRGRKTLESGRLFISNPEGLFSYDGATGRELWRMKDPLWLGAARGGRIFSHGIDRGIRATLEGPITAFSARTGEREWRARGLTGVILGTDRSHLYYRASEQRVLGALSLASGSTIWEIKVDQPGLKELGLPISENESVKKLHVSDEGLLLYVSENLREPRKHTWYDLDGETGKIRWSFTRDFSEAGRVPDLDLVQEDAYLLYTEGRSTYVLDLSLMSR